jgi:hypothetical protein
MIGNYIFSKLSADATVHTYVADRISPLVAAEATDRPHITYQVLSATPNDTKTSASRLDEVLVQITIYDPVYLNALGCALAVRQCLDRSSGTATGVVVQSTQFTGQRDMYDMESKVTGVSQDFMFRVQNPLNL